MIFLLACLFLGAGFLASCAMPQRTGYDRKAGAYKRAVYNPKKKTSVVQSSKKTTPKKPSGSSSPSSAGQGSSAGATSASLEKVIRPWMGTPYRYGGSSRSGTDCSGFVMRVMKAWKDIDLPHSTREGWKMGKRISRGSLEPGDVVYFGSWSGVSHSGIYVGNNHFVHASSSKGVIRTSLDNSYWKPKYKGARRY
jgi:cell wall-associated NlpC family hydrolase